jgi:hypothetical protein
MNQQQFMALPEDQRKALQQKLIDDGLYAGKADGKFGAGTKAAFEQVAKREAEGAKSAKEAEERKRQDDLRAQEIEVEKLKAQGTKTASDAEAAKIGVETARRQRYDDQASSAAGMVTQGAANLVAPAAGGALGWRLGQAINNKMNESQEGKNKTLQNAAKDRLAGITTRDGARDAVTRAGAMPSASVAGRVASRMAPHVALGAFGLGKGAQVYLGADPEGEFYPYQADRAAGLAYIGSGLGMMKQGVSQAAAPKVSPDAQALGIINSNQLRRNGAQGALAQALTAGSQPSAPTQSQAIPAAPAAIQAPGQRHRDALGRFAKAPKGAVVPGLAAALAYGMTPDEAQAADGSTVGGTGEAMTNAGIAGGAAYGTSKLAQALAPALRGGLGMVGEAMAPASIDAMTDYSDADLAQGRNMLARTLPQALQGGAVDQARQMATVPERGPQAQMAQDQRLQAEAMPMQSAQALQIPEGIPAPNPDGSSPYGEAIANRINRMVRLGAPPEAIANLLNQAVR